MSSVAQAVTLRAICCALVLGTIVCLTNMYLGLQAGTVNAMPMQTAVLGFALFTGLKNQISHMLTPAELTVIEVAAGALGLAPFTSGVIGFIPALEFLASPSENGPTKFSTARLIIWSLATCALGIVAAVPLRRTFILEQRLRYPSATATGTLIGVLYGQESIVDRANQPTVPTTGSQQVPPNAGDIASAADDADAADHPPGRIAVAGEYRTEFDANTLGHAISVLVRSVLGSMLFSLISYFLPVLRNLPIFGRVAAREWLWTFDLSPVYFGYGIIIGPSISMSTLLGAIIGWGVLSPIVKSRGWAPGPVDSWDDGVRGWIVWVGMGLILGDSIVGVGWTVLKPLVPLFRRSFARSHAEAPREREAEEHRSLLRGSTSHLITSDTEHKTLDDDWPKDSVVHQSLLVWITIGLIALYLLTFIGIFHNLIPVSATFVALVLIGPSVFLSARSLGQTDNGASLAIGRIAQFLIALSVPGSNTSHITANLMAGGAVEACCSQGSQHVGGLKTAYMTSTPPRAVLYGQVIGSVAGAFVATFIYKIYTSLNKIPSGELSIPDAHLWLIAARLAYQQGLPPHALNFAIAALVAGAACGTLKILAADRLWKDFVPSGVAMAVGMYIVPALTLPRAVGSLILLVGTRRFGIPTFLLMCAASGLILGQGLFSLIGLLLDVLHVPHL